jgi:hypothetical protein
MRTLVTGPISIFVCPGLGAPLADMYRLSAAELQLLQGF